MKAAARVRHPRARTIVPDLLMEVGTAYRRARVLLSAIELDLFTVLAEQPLGADELAQSLGLHPRGVRDFFDALVALGLLERDAGGVYANVPEAGEYLDRRKATFLGGMFHQYDKVEYRLWDKLSAALRTGRPQTGIDESEHFALLYRDPARFRTFVDAMTAGSLAAAMSIAEKFPWRDYGTLVDIGTAQGCLPVQVARAHRHISAAGFDLPDLADSFDAYARVNGLAERVRFHAGNFFTDPLPQADVLVFGRVLHNWDITTKRMLLLKAHDALPEGGAVIVYDTLIDDDRCAGAAGLLSSLNMLLWTAAGFGYTGAECKTWMHEAGFRGGRVEPLVAGQSMIVGTK